MLYVTTRNHQDAFTGHQVLTQNRGADGGLFVPLHIPGLSEKETAKLCAMSFGQCVAEILNLFFGTKLSGWDIDFSIGRYPVRLEELGHRILLAETWHNPDWQYERLEKNLMELLPGEARGSGNWVSVVIRMAVLAGILGNREIQGAGPVDISVVSEDFTVPISAWYLRKMGFPIGNIICCCNENNQLWELICNGQMRTDALSIKTIVSAADITLPVNLERLVFEYGGAEEAICYRNCCSTGEVYSVSDHVLQQLRQDFCVSVVSSSRVETTIPNVYKTRNYLLSPASALAYSGLLDYRTKIGIMRTAIVVCDKSPICDAAFIANAMKVPIAEIKNMI